MKIEQANVGLSATHEFSSESEVTSSFARSFRVVMEEAEAAEEVADASNETQQTRLLLFIQQLVGQMLELLSSTSASKPFDLRDLMATDADCTNSSAAAFTAKPDTVLQPARQLQLEWSGSVTETLREHESTDFSASATIRTADGRDLDVTLGLAMCRDFECTRTVTQTGTLELRDPLVINFDGNAAELSGKCFAFDLDADGSAESLRALAGSSGYLAIDRNGDGRINDGSELFGTRSGNGFADLATLDSDGNHWLDESDSAFDQLSVWNFSDTEQGVLSSLREQSVGALYLGSTETPFSLTDDENKTLARIRSTGLYLHEDGRAGTLQQVDLAV